MWWRKKGGEDGDETAYFIILPVVPGSSRRTHVADILVRGVKLIRALAAVLRNLSEPLE